MAVEDDVPIDPNDPQAKKGRPTPKRRDAEAQRRQVAKPPKSRREAARTNRERTRTERLKQREAMMRGDESALPPRDRGPERKFVRNFIDSRTCVAEFFLPFAIVILVLSMLPNPALKSVSLLFWLLLIILIVLDSIRIAIRLRRGVKERFPDSTPRGLTMYGLMRTLQMRRMRLPKPQVKRGQQI